MKNLAFVAYSDERWLYLPILTTSPINFPLKGWGNVLFKLGSEWVNLACKALAKRSSHLEPCSQLRCSWVSFGHPLGSSWIKLAWIWPNSNFRPTWAKFSTVWPPQPTLTKLFCYCYVTTQSYSDNWMVSCKQAWVGGTVWPPADASFVTWLELAWVGSTIWPGLKAVLLFSGLWCWDAQYLPLVHPVQLANWSETS